MRAGRKGTVNSRLNAARLAHLRCRNVAGPVADVVAGWAALNVRKTAAVAVLRLVRGISAGRGARTENGPTGQTYRPPEARGDQAPKPR
jgi:hypothetical protein